MKQRIIVFIALTAAVFSFTGVVLAQEETELSQPGLTPLSPFYFLDRLGDWARLNILTFNPVRKAEIKIEIAGERLAELNDVFEKAPAKTDILEKLEAEVETGASEANSEAEKLDSENRNVSKIMERLNSFFLKRQEVLEKVIERVPEKVKEKIEIRFGNIQKQIEKHREILLKQKEKGFMSEEKLGSIIQKSLDRLKDQKEKAEKIIREVKEKISETEEKLSQLKERDISAAQNIDELLIRASGHLEKAKAAFGESRFGEAFGQATAALRNVNNALRSVERISEGEKEEKNEKEKNEIKDEEK